MEAPCSTTKISEVWHVYVRVSAPRINGFEILSYLDLIRGGGVRWGVTLTQSGSLFSFQPFPEKGCSRGGGLCSTFFKSLRNGCFGKVWVLGGLEATFLSTRGGFF